MQKIIQKEEKRDRENQRKKNIKKICWWLCIYITEWRRKKYSNQFAICKWSKYKALLVAFFCALFILSNTMFSLFTRFFFFLTILYYHYTKGYHRGWFLFSSINSTKIHSWSIIWMLFISDTIINIILTLLLRFCVFFSHRQRNK